MLRSLKNRFGSTDEIALFDMSPAGMAAVPNPSAALLQHRETAAGGEKRGLGSIVGVLLAGRPILVELQALATPLLESQQPRMSFASGECSLVAHGGGGVCVCVFGGTDRSAYPLLCSHSHPLHRFPLPTPLQASTTGA